MVCPKCNSSNVNVQAVAETKKRGCLGTMLWILLAICTCGLVLLIPLLRGKKTKTKQYAVCQSCGYKWHMSRGAIQQNVEYMLICDTCGKSYSSHSQRRQKCNSCSGHVVYCGITKNQWATLDKNARDKLRQKVAIAPSEAPQIAPPHTADAVEKTCPHCGHTISATAKHCPYCGKATTTTAEISVVHKKTCPQCKKEYSESAKFCPYCGKPEYLPDSNVPTPEPDVPSVPKKHPCPHCKKEISETAVFCPYCGKDPKRLTEPEPVPHTDDIVEERGTRYCPHCGKLISETVAFCPHCNKDVRREIKKPQLIVNLAKEKPALETPPVEKKADAAFELAVVEKTPTPQENVIENLPEQPKEKPVVEEIPAPQENETEDLPEQPMDEVYQGKHLKPSGTPEDPKEEVVKVTEAEVIHVVTIPEKESIPEPSVKEEPVPAPRNKGFAPPEDLD